MLKPVLSSALSHCCAGIIRNVACCRRSNSCRLREEIGLAVSIGEWVLNRVCRDATSWPESITAAVSVSPLQFASDKLASSVEHALQAAELPGKRLEIGVTEEILLRNNSSVLKTLTALKALGMKVGDG